MSNAARKAEVSDEKVGIVKFRNLEFTIPLDYAEWPLELHEALEDGREIAVLRAALGLEQWTAIRKMNLKTDGLNELAAAVASALGFKSVGESPDSVD